MNEYDKLKLAVYESGLPFDDACEIINTPESCSDEDLPDAIDATLEILEKVDVKALASKGKATIGDVIGKIPAVNKEKIKKACDNAKKKLATTGKNIITKCNAKSIALTKEATTLKNKIDNALKKLQKKGPFKEAQSDIEARALTPIIKAKVLKLQKLNVEISKCSEEISALQAEAQKLVLVEIEKGNKEIEKALVLGTLFIGDEKLYINAVNKLNALYPEIQEKFEKLGEKLAKLQEDSNRVLEEIDAEMRR